MTTEREFAGRPHRAPLRAVPSPPGGTAQAARRRAERFVLIPPPGRLPDGGGIGVDPNDSDPTASHPDSLRCCVTPASVMSMAILLAGGVK